MAATDTRTTKKLFTEWRAGDGEAGQLMAQRFADWYYAIATSRLGEDGGREPCENACSKFGEGIVDVSDARALTKWAHDIIVDELKGAGSRVRDGDEANAYTGNQQPKLLLAKAKKALPAEMELLEARYGGQTDDAQIDALAEPLGGNPLGILKARYSVKRWLRDHARVPFEVAPDKPVLDRAPLPLYESDAMANAAEETSFEHWMLSDIDLCKDIAEFAVFSIALRGGIPDTVAEPSKPQGDQGGGKGGEAGGGGGAGVAAAGVGIAGVLVVGGAIVVIVGLLAGALFMFM